MDPGLHVKQAINHLNKVLAYYPYVAENGEATVALTPEDWGVVADAFFHMGTPPDVFPDAIESYRRALEINPRNFPAMDALERIHRQEGEWIDAIQVMETRAAGLDEPSQKVQVLLAIAEA